MSLNLGDWGENRAAEYLREQGYRILERNLTTPVGECDLLAADGDCRVFVEVKTRSHHAFGPPEASVTENKRDQIRRVARFVLANADETLPCRFDVIAITRRGSSVDLRHIRGAFGDRG